MARGQRAPDETGSHVCRAGAELVGRGVAGLFAILFGLCPFSDWPDHSVVGPVLLRLHALDGVFGIIAAVRAARQGERWGLLVLEGILNIAVGVIALLMPGLTVIAFVLLLAAWSLSPAASCRRRLPAE